MKFIQSALKYPQVTLTVIALVVLAGLSALLNMPRREDPRITNLSALCYAAFPGATGEQVEEQVGKKIEDYLFRYSEVNKGHTITTCKDGLVFVNIELNPAVKDPQIFWAKLREDLLQLKLLNLPDGVVGPFVNSEFGDTIAMLIAIESDALSYGELTDYVDQLDDNLRGIKAVSKINRLGGLPDQISVTANSFKLAQYGIKLPQVVQVLQSQNAIKASGTASSAQTDVPLYARGYYGSEQEVANQIISSSAGGGTIRLGDVASVKREAGALTQEIKVDGHKAMLISLEMQEGNNVVKFGQEVTAHLAQFQKSLPATAKITTLVNQPAVVDGSISKFIDEFFLAILSVVVVTILLLPFRIAAVAAMAIPVTVAFTFAMLNWFGIELQQVSLAALIVVLGMVVDDAIVIADNYVELLDEGVDRREAAWRSASDLFVPVLTATITIIVAFLPLAFLLSGTMGEFIRSLPITVTIALSASFVIAMVLTPLLCYTFIKQGLHTPGAEPKPDKKKRASFLDYLQAGYNSALAWSFGHKPLVIGFGILSILAAGLLFTGVKQKFMPSAERNQFVVELLLPTNTKLDRTQQALRRVVNVIATDQRVVDYVSFAGTTAPRFYYNFTSPLATTNIAQLLINTHTNEETVELAAELSTSLIALVPEARVRVRRMEQGVPFEAPVELRIAGTSLEQIKAIGGKVEDLLRRIPGTNDIRTNWNEDLYGLGIHVTEEGTRLGFTTTSLATSTFIGFSGYNATQLYEGDKTVNVVLRLDSASRQNVGNLASTYVTSPVTGASVPLRQVATIDPEWHTGQIIRRNGIRTLSVFSNVLPGYYAADVVKAAKPAIEQVELPPGYTISFGAEAESSAETLSEMVSALMVSLLGIFLVLLFQFRSLKDSLLIMSAIPLSLLGAIFGLWITGNPFGFTAFLGIISLSGIVVRNAIILLEHTHLLMDQHGLDMATAAQEAGKRRLRPIFLTASAAAIGVVPMILSGSPLWSPLASVLAFGVMFSTVMALLVIPVLVTLSYPTKKIMPVEIPA